MTKTEAAKQVAELLSQLDRGLVDDFLAAAKHAAGQTPTVYETLPDWKKAQIEEARAALDRGEGIPAEQAFAKLRAKIKAAGA